MPVRHDGRAIRVRECDLRCFLDSPPEFGAQPGKGFEIPFVVAGKPHDNVRGPGIGKAFEKLGRAGGRAGLFGVLTPVLRSADLPPP